jgi:hypothetical protein
LASCLIEDGGVFAGLVLITSKNNHVSAARFFFQYWKWFIGKSKQEKSSLLLRPFLPECTERIQMAGTTSGNVSDPHFI